MKASDARVFRLGRVMAMFVISDGRVGTDEVEVIHAGFHVNARAALSRERIHIIEYPQRARHGVADAGSSAAGERVHFTDAIRTAATL